MAHFHWRLGLKDPSVALCHRRLGLFRWLMTNALEGYAVFKVAGKGQGLEDARKALAVRFARGSRTPTPPSDPAPTGPLTA